MEIIKICGIILISALVVVVLKYMGSPLSFCVISAACIISAALCLPRIGSIVSTISGYISDGASAFAFPAVLKITSVALICELSADICESAGEGTLSKIVTTAGRIEIIFLSLPLIEELLKCALSLCGI